VDRVTDPADHHKTGNMWIRDPVLSNEAGITLEVRVRIEPNSMSDSFSITYLDELGSWGVHLSPDRVKAGALAQGGTGNVVAFDTTNDFHLYRVVMPPNTLHLSVYVDNSPVPLVTGTGTGAAAVGSADRLAYPRVLVGDNSNNTIYNAHYVLDFIRYRRGVTAPGEAPGPLSDRLFPPLPPPADENESWTPGFEGDALPALPEWVPGGSLSRWTLHGDGTIELNTLAGAANARNDAPTGWPNLEAVTIEARIKVYDDSEDGAFNLWANDTLGGTSLNLSPDRAELSHGGKPAGRAPYLMDTTDGFHVYRIVREALDPFENPIRLGREMYWHLFIDDNPVPAVAWQHCVGWSLAYSRIVFGDFAYPIPDNGCHVRIDYIRWHEGASAPARFADVDRDGDVDLKDVSVNQRCFAREGTDDCTAADLDATGLVDLVDLETCLSCLAGPNVAPPGGCAR
jgi:hypothetical protein